MPMAFVFDPCPGDVAERVQPMTRTVGSGYGNHLPLLLRGVSPQASQGRLLTDGKYEADFQRAAKESRPLFLTGFRVLLVMGVLWWMNLPCGIFTMGEGMVG